jgi:hypothetical protein
MNCWKQNRLGRANIFDSVGLLKQRFGGGNLSFCEFSAP